MEAASAQGCIWDEGEATDLLQQLQGCASAGVVHRREWKSAYARPRALNTVDMLKMASSRLGLGPADAMHFAEQLYLKGLMSYPRTETNKYPENFDLQGTVQLMTGSDEWYGTLCTCRTGSGWGGGAIGVIGNGKIRHNKSVPYYACLPACTRERVCGLHTLSTR